MSTRPKGRRLGPGEPGAGRTRRGADPLDRRRCHRFRRAEVRRGRVYDGILLDPPRFGRGPAGEIWNLTDDLPHLVDTVERLLAPGPSFVTLTAYAIRASFLSVHELVADIFGHRPGILTSGELALREMGDPATTGRLLGTSMYARFEGDPA